MTEDVKCTDTYATTTTTHFRERGTVTTPVGQLAGARQLAPMGRPATRSRMEGMAAKWEQFFFLLAKISSVRRVRVCSAPNEFMRSERINLATRRLGYG